MERTSQCQTSLPVISAGQNYVTSSVDSGILLHVGTERQSRGGSTESHGTGGTGSSYVSPYLLLGGVKSTHSAGII